MYLRRFEFPKHTKSNISYILHILQIKHLSSFVSVINVVNQWIYNKKSTNQTINFQPTNESINQPTNQSIKQSINQSMVPCSMSAQNFMTDILIYLYCIFLKFFFLNSLKLFSRIKSARNKS